MATDLCIESEIAQELASVSQWWYDNMRQETENVEQNACIHASHNTIYLSYKPPYPDLSCHSHLGYFHTPIYQVSSRMNGLGGWYYRYPCMFDDIDICPVADPNWFKETAHSIAQRAGIIYSNALSMFGVANDIYQEMKASGRSAALSAVDMQPTFKLRTTVARRPLIHFLIGLTSKRLLQVSSHIATDGITMPNRHLQYHMDRENGTATFSHSGLAVPYQEAIKTLAACTH